MKPFVLFIAEIFIWLLLTGFSISCPASTPFFRNIGTEYGLSHPKVNCILQDKRGFLWFGTEDGLNRYDGHFFTIYKNQPNDTTCVSGNIITDLLEDKAGNLWIATADGGITRYDYHLEASKQFKQYKFNAHRPGGIPENHINKIAEDNDGNLWLATSNSFLVRLNKKSDRFDVPVKSGGRNILSLAMAGADTLWAGREDSGLLKINTHTLGFRIDKHYNGTDGKLPRSSIASIFKDRSNRMWYGDRDKKLYTYQLHTGVEQVFLLGGAEKKIPRDVIASFAIDKQGKIWMGTQGSGITTFDPAEMQFITYRHSDQEGSLVDDHINVVFTDSNGIIWIGTDNGISIYDPVYSPFNQYNLPKPAKKDITIFDFYRNPKDDALWIATSEGIYIKRNKSANYEHRNIAYKGNALSVTKFYVDNDGTFYLGTDYSLFRYDPLLNRATLLPNTNDDTLMKRLMGSRIVSIVRDTIGNHPALVVSPYGHYLTYYDFVDKKWISGIAQEGIKRLNVKDNVVKKFYKDKNGTLWLATDKYGLGALQQGATIFSYFTNDIYDHESISSNDVYDIEGDRKGNLWISTYGGGLNYFDKNELRFSHIPGSSNLTEGICSDARGNLWMICNGHMHEYNPETRVYSCYDLPDLKSNGGVKGYMYRDCRGNLYAAGRNFYIEFNPAGIGKIENEPDVYFTDFKIFNTSYSHLLENKTIRLNHNQNYFSLEFSAPEYSSNHMHYDYILEGVDKDWVDADKRNYASYSNLAGGRYLFKVRASNWKGSVVNKFASIVIVINPPFWRTWWFYSLIVLIIGPLCYLFYRYRINEFLKRQSIRNGIAQDLHDQIGSTLSSISIYSKVARIYQQQQKKEKLSEVLQTIGETADDTISEMSDIVWSINPKNDHMSNMIQKIRSYAQPLCVAKNIAFSLACDQRLLKLTLEMETRKNFFLILKETLNNAIKHSHCKKIVVDIQLKGSKINLKICDDGVGFNYEDKLAQAASAAEGGNGLRNIKCRVTELNGALVVKSSPGRGTTINFTFGNL
ncbi:sensor histidine kinase [Mucilaginibacter kameinonensis]|uniref:sensor histidine kinase n=1 Tax=Mucilaginibacter kameinonensis TaxID=452286 RepID=UPI000EF7A86D|nr:two-component regulator propeller domain-containing protein [Mucilaginibacter kameinonensis]